MARGKMERITRLWQVARHPVSIAILSIVVVLGLASFGCFRVYRYVANTAAYSKEPPKVVLKNRPVWMSDFLADQICAAARPEGGHSSLDREVLTSAKSLLENHESTSAWIKEIRQLKLIYGQKPGDTLVLDCEFRAPVALVQYQSYFYLVDGEGTLLPERYTLDQVGKVVFGRDGKMLIRVVDGVKSERPAFAGQKWTGADLSAAIDMVKCLHAQPYAEEITKVDVSNYAGRQDPKEAQLVLITRRNTQVRWGRPVTSKDLAEVPTQRKLEYMKSLYAEKGRVDGGLSWVDLRRDTVRGPASEIVRTASSQ